MKNSKDSHLLEQYACWVEEYVNPNVYAVATLKQALGSYGSGLKSWIRGDYDRYSAAYDQFIHRLSCNVYGATTYRRHGKLLLNAATLEGDGNLRRFHLNIMMHRPEWVSFDRFKAAFEKEWSRCPWAMTDMQIEERTGDCVTYSLKEGFGTLLICR